MKIPTIRGIIERRILVNFAIDPYVAKAIIPAPFQPKLVAGYAMAGICLIRLNHVRPKGLPAFVGIGSENGAHRIAVEWLEDGVLKEGVYIPRRDTSSRLNTLVGGRLFPGRHYHADFNVIESGDDYHVSFKSADKTFISIDATITDRIDSRSVFKDLDTASNFFKLGATGYSPNKNKYDGLLLKTYKWEVKPLKVRNVISSYFNDERVFPKGSVQFDNALLMTNIEHEWSSVADKVCRP